MCSLPSAVWHGASRALDSLVADKQEYGFISNRETGNPQHHQEQDFEISV